MANTKIQHKRTSVSGRLANTTDPSNSAFIDAGEFAVNLADNKVFASNGTVAFEIGSNLSNLSVSGTITVNGTSINSTNYSGTANNANYLSNISLSTLQSQITGNAATAFANAIANAASNAASIYQTYAGLPANVLMLTANSTTYLSNSSGTLANISSWITGNAATSYANAVANAAALYQTHGGLASNVLILAANSATYLSNSSGTLANIASWITGNSTTAYTNAISYANSAAVIAYSNAINYAANGVTNGAIVAANSTYSSNSGALGGLSLATLQSQITGNAATAYSNAAANAAAIYQTHSGLASNVLILAANSATYLSNSSGTLANIASWVTGNAATAYANAVANAAALYQTTIGLSANILTLTANSANYIGTLPAANVVSNAQLQSNLASYALLSGATFSGVVNTSSNVNITGSLVVTGNLTIAGQTTYVNTTVISTSDKAIYLSANSTSSLNSDGSGIVATNAAALLYNDSTKSWQANISITPTTNSTFNLGGSANYWSNVYANQVYGTLMTVSQPNITANNSTNFGGLSLTTVQGQITGNAATAFSNAIANAASNAAGIYQTMAGLSANVATLTANASGYLGNSSGTIANISSWVSGNAATAYSNAVANAAALYQTTAGLSANVLTLTSNNALNLGGVAASKYVNTSGTYTLSGVIDFMANTIFQGGISANGVYGNTDQALTSNGSGGVYWRDNPPVAIDQQMNGFLDGNAETSISFDGTNTFTLTDTGSGWHIYISGKKYYFTGNRTVTLSASPPATAGRYFVSINSTGNLSVSNTSWDWTDPSIASVAFINWNNSNTPKYFMSDERHTVLMTLRHRYNLHTTVGPRIQTFGALGYTLGGTTSANNLVTASVSVIEQEDLIKSITAITANTVGVNNYTTFYRTAVNPDVWTWGQSDMPFIYQTGGGYIDWDNSGVLTSGTNNNYYNSYVLMTTYGSYTIVTGRGSYASLADAQAEDITSWDWSAVTGVELVFAYQLTWKAKSSSSQEGRVALQAVRKIAVSTSSAVSSLSSAVHNQLSGLQGGYDASEFYHLNATSYSAVLNTASLGLGIGNGLTSNSTYFYVNANTGIIANASGLYIDPSHTANLANYLANSSGTLSNIQSWITGNSATAYTNSVNYVANGVTNGTILAANATYATNSGALGGLSLTTIQSQITGNAATAYSNATTYSSNASNLSTGTVSTARLGSGTANSTTVLYGNGVWSTVSGGGSVNTAAQYTWTNTQIYSSNIVINNNIDINFKTTNGNTVSFIQQSDDNFVFYSTNASGAARAIWSVFANSATSNVNFSAPVNFSANVGFSSVALYANGSSGTTGQVLSSNGTGLYWQSLGAASVNTAAQYTWTNTHSFTANVSFSGTGLGLTTNTTAIYFNGVSDANWRMSRNSSAFTKAYYTNNSIDIAVAGSSLEGFSIGQVGNVSFFETGYAGSWFRSNVAIGNVTWSSAMLTVGGTANVSGNLIAGTTSTNVQVQFLSNSQIAPSAGFTGNASLLIGGGGGNYLAIGQSNSTLGYAYWMQSGFNGASPVYYPINLNPLGGNVSIGSTSIPTATLSVTGTANISGNVAFASNVSITGNSTSELLISTINTTSSGIIANGTIITLGNSSVNVSINSTAFSGTSNNSTNFGGLSLTTLQGQITGNSATAYSNATSYTDTSASTTYTNAINYSANGVTNGAWVAANSLYSSNSGALGGISLATLQNQITGNASTAYTNAVTRSANASNITTGTLPYAQLPANVVIWSNNNVFAGNQSFSNAQITVKLQVGPISGFDFGANALIQIDGTTNTYLQSVIQNANSGTNASGDLVITSDTGNDSVNYVDLGINSSTYNQAGFNITGIGDAYLYSSNSNLVIGTASAKEVVFHANGTTSTDRKFTINATSITVANTVSFVANGSAGTNGQVLSSNGTGLFWASPGSTSRVISYANSSTFTVNADSTDIATMIYTGTAGTFTIANTTGTPVNGQKLIIRLQTTNSQTLSFAVGFTGSSDLALPTTTTGSSKTDYLGFIYNSSSTVWNLLAKNFGF